MSVIKLDREVAVQTAKWNCLTVEQQLDMIYTVLLHTERTRYDRFTRLLLHSPRGFTTL